MEIKNAEMLLYSMNKSVDEAAKALAQDDKREAFFRVGTAVHWIVDCIDRLKEVYPNYLQEEDIELCPALHCANNALKHSIEFIALQEQNHGYGFKFDFPIQMKAFYNWADLDNIDLRHENQKVSYKKILKGRSVDQTLAWIKKRINDIFEEIEQGR